MTPRDLPNHRVYPTETTGISVLANISSLLGEEEQRRNALREWERMPKPVAEPCPSPAAPAGVHHWLLTPPMGENGEEWGTCLYCKKVTLHRSKALVATSTKRNLPSPAPSRTRLALALDAIPRGTVRLIDHSETKCRRDEKKVGKYHCALYQAITLSNRRHVVAGKLSVVRHLSPGWADVRRESI